jgi:hypothetical protein
MPKTATWTKMLAACSLIFTLTGFQLFGPSPDQLRRTNYIVAHPGLSSSVQALIENGRVAPGMTEDEVAASWGPPPADCSEWQENLMTIWDYCHHPGRTLVIFDQNGRVSNVQIPQ